MKDIDLTVKDNMYIGKTCAKCGNNVRYNVENRCVYCRKISRKSISKRYMDSHKEECRERQKQWREKNRDHCNAWARENSKKESSRETQKRWRKKNRKKILKQRKENRNKPENKKKRKLYKLKNKHKIKAQAYEYRGRLKNAEGSFTENEWKDVCEKHGNKCLRCGKTDNNLTVDHIVPLIKGGDNYITNIQPLCYSCNCSKRDNTVDYRPYWVYR